MRADGGVDQGRRARRVAGFRRERRELGRRAGPVTPDSATFEGLAEAKAQAAELAGGGRRRGRRRARARGGAARGAERVSARRGRSRRRGVCADAGRADVALRAAREALQDELQATRLEMWDPELSAQLLRLLLWARQKALPPTQMNPEEHQRSREAAQSVWRDSMRLLHSRLRTSRAGLRIARAKFHQWKGENPWRRRIGRTEVPESTSATRPTRVARRRKSNCPEDARDGRHFTGKEPTARRWRTARRRPSTRTTSTRS